VRSLTLNVGYKLESQEFQYALLENTRDGFGGDGAKYGIRLMVNQNGALKSQECYFYYKIFSSLY